MVFRIMSAVMAVFFAFAAAVQYNDPDPSIWMSLYGVAGVLSAWVVVCGSVPMRAAITLSIVTLVMGLIIGSRVYGYAAFPEIFQGWEMKSPTSETLREASGLLIVSLWMAVLSIQAWLGRRK